MRAKTIVLIIAVVLVVAGIVMAACALVSTDFDWRRMSVDGVAVEKHFDAEASEIRSITVREFDKSVILEPSADGRIHVIYFETKKEFYSIQNNDGNLFITMETSKRWYNFIGLSIERQPTTIIQLPTEFFGDVDLGTKNGEVDVNGLTVKGKLALSTSNGRVRVDNLTVDGNFDAETDNGRISLDNVTVAGDASAKTSNSGVSANNVAAWVLTLHTSNGSVSLSGIDVEEKLDCKSSNGGIRGTVKGKMSDFRITSKTSNGKNNLPSSSTEGYKELVIKSSNGSIDIGFE